ncbi:cadherin-like beta sandwich domain-containing protein [Peribacillus butanolivorans]|uniref:cadherin-like beta sandwich domain-containing protein n=1 Tax=Peribacillus butanolivorans TaxID=421767 RepID=UPI00167F9705|nr:cadherin-like beta sandwich domain-containing protein [Peribacillus butanolivorans]QNU06620.1 cadherin-like beta sandwich domain-containing protein [Peribacillus butanolivorans]
MLKKRFKEKGVKVILVGSLVGMGTFTYLPTAEATEDTAVTQGEAQTVNTLSKLEIDGITLNQQFSADVLEYSATVGKNVEKISLLAESSSETATVSVNGIQLTNGKAEDFSLQTGKNTFTITVSDGINETTTYTVRVDKSESDDNLLTAIGLSKGSLTFDASVTAYKVSLANKVNTITVAPTVSDSTARVSVNGIDATSKGVKVNLPVGKTTVKIVVAAENGDEKTYTLTITRAAAKAMRTEDKDSSKGDEAKKESSTGTSKTQPSSDNGDKPSSTPSDSSKGQVLSSQAPKAQQIASISTQKTLSDSVKKEMSSVGEEGNNAPVLNTLTVSKGTWNKSFDSDEHTYHIEVDKDITSVQIEAIASASGATIKYDGESSKTVTIKNKAKTAISVTVSKDGARRTYVLVFDKDIDVDMDEEETVDDAKTEKGAVVGATQMSTSSKSENLKSNNKGSQMMPMDNQSTESVSFFWKIKKFILSLF